MNELVQIIDKQVERVEYQGEPVVTLQQVDDLHDKAPDTAGRTFRRYREKLIVEEDYFEVPYEEWNPLVGHLMGRQNALVRTGCPNQSGGHRGEMIFLTESGYLLVTKPFTDDLSWKVQRELVRRYFIVQQLQQSYFPWVGYPGPLNWGKRLEVLHDANIERQKLDFHGDKMWAAKINKDGQPAIYVAFGPLCNSLGMSSHGQAGKMRTRPLFKAGYDLLWMPTQGGCKAQRCLRYELVPLWVTTIAPPDEYSHKIIRYQKQFKEFVEIEMNQ